VSKLAAPKQAAARVWAALQPLANANENIRGRRAKKANKAATKPTPARHGVKKPKAVKPTKSNKAVVQLRDSSKKAEVIALLRRAKGARLSEIQKLTGWQKHTVRGFISLLGSKAGLKIISARNDSGERSYRIAK
jgi:hypothetical protein